MKKPTETLQHAIAHCKFGSNADNTIREPLPADLEAAEVLDGLRRKIQREGLCFEIAKGLNTGS